MAMAPEHYIQVLDPLNSSLLDINSGFTFEAWILNLGETADQKIGGKVGPDFKNGFIYGIDNSQVSFEVFNNVGFNTNLKAGQIPDFGWTHVAGTYAVGGMLTIYINGEKVGEKAASAAPHNHTNSPFRIGIAPWDVNALGFAGAVDEIRYWNAVLDGATIRDWMHKDIASGHPNFASLALYYKFSVWDPTAVNDEATTNFPGIFFPPGLLVEPIFLPFKGDFDLFENDVQGVWNTKTTGSSDILSVEAIVSDPTIQEQSVVFAHSDGDYSLNTNAPVGYDAILSKTWRVTTQGELLTHIAFDLSPISLPGNFSVELLSSYTPEFTSPSAQTGTLDGDVFNVDFLLFTEGYYYTLGFKYGTSVDEAASAANRLQLLPNPNKGAFAFKLDTPAKGALTAIVYDLQGREVGRRDFSAGQQQYEADFSESLQSGQYYFVLSDEDGLLIGRRLMGVW